NHPMDLLFEDINRDGYIDISVKDNTNIHLFDAHTPQTIWASPPLDYMYKCYTMGDRNDDGWIDIAIVKKEPFTRRWIWENYDTVWVDIYQGPSFSGHSYFEVLLFNVHVSENILWEYYEIPTAISINKISGLNGLEPVLILFTDVNETIWNFFSRYWIYNTGKLFIFDAVNYNLKYSVGLGKQLFHNFQTIDNNIFLNVVSSYHDSTIDYYWQYRWNITTCTADSVLYSNIIYRQYYDINDTVNWNGFKIDDFSSINGGLENCYSAEDTLVLLRFPQVDTLWTAADVNIGSVLYRFADSSLYDSPQIFCSMSDQLMGYRLFDGSDGSLSGVLLNAGYQLSAISDLDNNGRDEILSIQGLLLYIYNLDYTTGIGDDSRLPYRAFLLPNYPNPFNSSTTIEYGLPEAGRVRIDIYDLLGRRVETLVDEEMQARRYHVVWDASGYSSGIYFYRIEAGDFVDTKRMVFLK
ncbi:MAG: T9SS type A sorting domain-containing protein, partial [Candidatus Zixiibacteriota bacterium]